MSFWQFLDNNPLYAMVLAGMMLLAIAVVIFAVVLFLIRFSIIWKWYKEAKNAADFNSLSESIRRQLRKKTRSFVFASSVNDNDMAYKDIKNLFDKDGKIQFLDESFAGNFDKVFSNYGIIVYQVTNDDANKSNSMHKDYDSSYQPLYKSLAKYCVAQQKQCVLLTVERIDDKEFDPVYITTVNYYAKLRETLYILLHFTP